MLIIGTILAILVSIAIPSLLFLKQYNLGTELEKIHIVCQLLQQQAVSSGQKQELSFNTHNHSFFYNHHSQKLTEGAYFGYMLGVNGPPANPKEPISAPVTFPHQKAIFYPNGTISAGTVYLTDQNKKSLYALTIPVSQVSFIRKYKYQNGAWIYLK